MKKLLAIAALVLLLASPAWGAVFAPASGSPDTFGGTAGTELHAYDADWTQNTHYSAQTSQISSPNGYAISGGTPGSLYYYAVSPSSADYTVQADVYRISGGGMGGPAARVDTSTASAYAVQYTSGAWHLVKIFSGSTTSLGTSATPSVTTGGTYTVALTCAGTTISVVVNGTQIISVTDSSITSAGYPGLNLLSDLYSKITNWQAQSGGVNSHSYTMSGGAISGGSSSYSRGTVTAMSGGGVAGGAASYLRGKVFAMSGGGIAGGSSTYSFHTAGIQSYSWIMTGGGIVGGSAGILRGVLRAMTGGGITGGSAPYSRGKVYAMNGGAVAGGSTAFGRGRGFTMIGGAVAGGQAFYTRLAHFIMSGGGIAGGSSAYSVTSLLKWISVTITGSGPSLGISASGPSMGLSGSGPSMVIKGGPQ